MCLHRREVSTNQGTEKAGVEDLKAVSEGAFQRDQIGLFKAEVEEVVVDSQDSFVFVDPLHLGRNLHAGLRVHDH